MSGAIGGSANDLSDVTPVCARGPHLLTAQPPTAIRSGCAGSQSSQIRARFRLAEELARDHITALERSAEPDLQLRLAVDNDGRCHHAKRHRQRCATRCIELSRDVVEYTLVFARQTPTAEFHRTSDPAESVVEELAPPFTYCVHTDILSLWIELFENCDSIRPLAPNKLRTTVLLRRIPFRKEVLAFVLELFGGRFRLFWRVAQGGAARHGALANSASE